MQVHWVPSPVSKLYVPVVGPTANGRDRMSATLGRMESASITIRSSSTPSSGVRRRSSTRCARSLVGDCAAVEGSHRTTTGDSHWVGFGSVHSCAVASSDSARTCAAAARPSARTIPIRTPSGLRDSDGLVGQRLEQVGRGILSIEPTIVVPFRDHDRHAVVDRREELVCADRHDGKCLHRPRGCRVGTAPPRVRPSL